MANKYLYSLLIRAGVTEVAAALYVFIKENNGCSVADAVRNLKWGKSSVYRAFEELKNLNLVANQYENWESSLALKDFSTLINKLENEGKKQERLVSILKSYSYCEESVDLGNAKNIEFLNMDETFERYLDLSKMKWDSVMVFGNWEFLANRNQEIGEKMLKVEKTFISNRLKGGGKALGAVTETGPYTNSILDFNNESDIEERRKSYLINQFLRKPFFVSVFEGNDYVHIWEADKKGEVCSTFVNTPTFANFYKDFIYSKVV